MAGSSGHDRRLRPLADGLPDMRFDDVEPDGDEYFAQVFHRPPVCRDDGVIELLDHWSLEEPDQESASGAECATELHQGTAYRVGFMMDEGVPGEDAAEHSRFAVEFVEVAYFERHRRVLDPTLL